MRRFAFLLAFLFVLMGYVTPASSAMAAPKTGSSKARVSAQMLQIVELVNIRRREAGLRPLSVHPTLMACAQRYSEVQAAQGAINHTGPDGSNPGQRLTRCGYRWRHYGENLAAGFTTPEEVVGAWMNSASHRRVLLHSKVTEIGLGHTNRPNDPGQFYDYYVMEVGIRK
jgi:uncharacterized protein YkwD